MVNLLAFDLGATSGRAVVGQFSQDQLTIHEVHRFPNDPVRIEPHYYWDILRLFYEMQQGLLKSRHLGYRGLASMGVDSWAVDFGLLGEGGELLGNPIHYRDPQTVGMMEKVFEKVAKEEIFKRTGIQFMPINSLYHLYAMQQNQFTPLRQARSLLMIPDLLRYFLTGEMLSEFTNATTTQLFHIGSRQWDEEILQRLQIPRHLFQEVVEPGTMLGEVRPSLRKEWHMESIPVIAVCEHDTASAVVSIPAEQTDFAYLSCGTWSLLGTEVRDPVIDQRALSWNFTNEGGYGGTYRLLKNIMGLWLLEECKRIWEKEGRHLTYPQIKSMAEEASPFTAWIDPDDARFLHPDHMPEAIQSYCRETGQMVPQTVGEMARCIMESLALTYRYVLERTEQLTGRIYSGLHMVGGGINNQLLCQYTANALGRPVWAGPTEGTATGNLLVQLIALGELSDIWEARQLVRRSFPIRTHDPQDLEIWEQAYEQFCELIEGERR